MNAPLGPLFRAEVIDARRQRIDGSVVLAQSTGTHVLVVTLCGLMALLVLWVVMGSFSRTEAVRGMLVTDAASAKVLAMRPGQIVDLWVKEGDLVAAGQRIASIRVEQGNEAGGSAAAEILSTVDAQRNLTQGQIDLAHARAKGEQERVAATLAGLGQQRSDLLAQIEVQNESIASSKDLLDRIESLVAKGFVSRVEVERRRQAWLAARQELGRLRFQLNAIAADERRARADLSRIAADAGGEIASARLSVQTLTQQKVRLKGERSYTVTAPIAGRVAALQAGVGRSVDPSVPLLIIVPERTGLHADVFAPTRAIGFVKPGQEVRLLYDAFPYQRFGSFTGRVRHVSRTVIDPRELSAPVKVDEPVYRLEVVPDAQSVRAFGEKQPLQPGMTLTANIILERRSFLDWLLAPLHAVMQRNR